MEIRNIAIIAHVDHGKTTLVDRILQTTKVFRDNQETGELIMDSNDLERERGITIFSKNVSVTYKGIKINVIDTPGHKALGSLLKLNDYIELNKPKLIEPSKLDFGINPLRCTKRSRFFGKW